MKNMLDLYFDSVKERISRQTGFLHHYYDAPEGKDHDTIPFLENLYYVLALFRTHMAERVLDARARLCKLMAFEVSANFPVYLHQYPQCLDRSLSAMCLLPLFYLLKDYKVAMGEDLAASIEALAKRIAARAHELQKEKPLSFAASVRLEVFEGRLQPKEPVSAGQWSEYMLCLTTQSDKAWARDQLQKMTALYNRTLSVFTAEKRALLFLGCHVKPSLVDAFIAMQLSNKQIPLDAQTLLSLPLLFPVALEPVCRIEKTELMHPGHQKDPVYFFFQDGAHTRSLCVVGAFGGILLAQKTEDGFDLCYTYPPSVPEEEQSLELSFYIDVNGAFSLQVNGKATTTFTEKDLSELYLENHIVQLSFAVDRGEGRLFGHLMKDDRPCQIGKEMRSGTDFRLALRTLQRSSDLMVSFKIRLIDRLA